VIVLLPKECQFGVGWLNKNDLHQTDTVEMRNEISCRNMLELASSWLLPQSTLYIAMMISVILSLMNLRGGMVMFTDDVHLNPATSREASSVQPYYVSDVSKQNHSIRLPIEIQNQPKRPDRSFRIKPTKNETVVVGLANKAYASVAILWYRRMTEVGFDTHRILAADKATAWICEEHEIRYDDLSKFTQASVPSCSHGQFARNDWSRKTYLFAARWIYVRQKLLDGYHVLLTDVDAVYNDVAPISRLEQSGYDHYTAYANKMPEHIFQQVGFTICGCFNWMRSTPSMIQFLDLFLSNCGCKAGSHHDESRSSCKCHCDDQVTMNSMLFYQLDMEWEHYEGTMNGEFFQNSMIGISRRTGQRIKVMDRSFVFRGHHNNTCTKGNWITFPKTSNKTEPKIDQMKRLLANCPFEEEKKDVKTTFVSDV
jgi:hypothetical protein